MFNFRSTVLVSGDEDYQGDLDDESKLSYNPNFINCPKEFLSLMNSVCLFFLLFLQNTRILNNTF